MLSKKGVSLIALIITIIVIIILAAIVLSSGSDTTNKAQLAVFVNNFSQYSDKVTIESLNLKQTLGVSQQNINDAQLNYMVANGLTSTEDFEVKNKLLPVGYVLPNTLKKIFNIQSHYDEYSGFNIETVVAYVIDDYNISGYNAKGNNLDGSAGYEFYGDTNGLEYHFITSNGHVFTLPGFAIKQDDETIKYYISNEKGAYYIVSGQSKLSIGDLNVNGDRVDELKPITLNNFLVENQNFYNYFGINSDGTFRTIGYDFDYPQGTPGRNTLLGGEVHIPK